MKKVSAIVVLLVVALVALGCKCVPRDRSSPEQAKSAVAVPTKERIVILSGANGGTTVDGAVDEPSFQIAVMGVKAMRWATTVMKGAKSDFEIAARAGPNMKYIVELQASGESLKILRTQAKFVPLRVGTHAQVLETKEFQGGLFLGDALVQLSEIPGTLTGLRVRLLDGDPKPDRQFWVFSEAITDQ